jgi:pimeloyl-ACP methyl ester carboxylesterase
VGVASSDGTQYASVVIDEPGFTHRTLDVGDLRLHAVEAGEGPLVILLHGFPEFWYAWRRQIPALAAAGFRVVAPDMRGYNLSDKPGEVSAYGIGTLARDVQGLIHACGEKRAHVVGHDWGGGVAWMFAMQHPDALAKLAILNSPHPLAMLRGLRSPRQMIKSWYMFAFQLPILPERAMRANGYELLIRPLRDEPTTPGAFDAQDLAAYAEAFARPGALTGMTNYYRAMMRGRPPKMTPIDSPVLILWGDADPHIGSELATPDPKMVPNARVELLRGASHWVQHDRPEQVNAKLIDYLRS